MGSETEMCQRLRILLLSFKISLHLKSYGYAITERKQECLNLEILQSFAVTIALILEFMCLMCGSALNWRLVKILSSYSF